MRRTKTGRIVYERKRHWFYPRDLYRMVKNSVVDDLPLLYEARSFDRSQFRHALFLFFSVMRLLKPLVSMGMQIGIKDPTKVLNMWERFFALSIRDIKLKDRLLLGDDLREMQNGSYWLKQILGNITATADKLLP